MLPFNMKHTYRCVCVYVQFIVYCCTPINNCSALIVLLNFHEIFGKSRLWDKLMLKKFYSAQSYNKRPTVHYNKNWLHFGADMCVCTCMYALISSAAKYLTYKYLDTYLRYKKVSVFKIKNVYLYQIYANKIQDTLKIVDMKHEHQCILCNPHPRRSA